MVLQHKYPLVLMDAFLTQSKVILLVCSPMQFLMSMKFNLAVKFKKYILSCVK